MAVHRKSLLEAAAIRRRSEQLVRLARMSVRASREILAEISRQRQQYPERRLMRLRGGSDTSSPDIDPTIQRLYAVRKQILTGVLRRDRNVKTWFGKGTGRSCDGCQETISEGELDVQLEFSDGKLFRFHNACFECWQIETGNVFS